MIINICDVIIGSKTGWPEQKVKEQKQHSKLQWTGVV